MKSLNGLMLAQTLSMVTEASTPQGHSDPLAIQMKSIETNMATLNVDLAQWMAKVQQILQTVPSPGSAPSKLTRACSNSSSHQTKQSGATIVTLLVTWHGT